MMPANLCSTQAQEASLYCVSGKDFAQQHSLNAATQQKAQQQFANCCAALPVCWFQVAVPVHAEEDPFSDELDVEKELARLICSADKSEELQDLDR